MGSCCLVGTEEVETLCSGLALSFAHLFLPLFLSVKWDNNTPHLGGVVAEGSGADPVSLLCGLRSTCFVPGVLGVLRTFAYPFIEFSGRPIEVGIVLHSTDKQVEMQGV